MTAPCTTLLLLALTACAPLDYAGAGSQATDPLAIEVMPYVRDNAPLPPTAESRDA